MTGALSAQQGPLGVAASLARPVEKPGLRDNARVADPTHAELGRPLPHRVNPARHRRQNEQHDQPVEPQVSPATLLEASLIAATLVVPDEPTRSPSLPRTTPWQPPASSLPLRDRTA